MEAVKVCKGCGLELALEAFPLRSKKAGDGRRRARCKDCTNRANRGYQAKQRARNRAQVPVPPTSKRCGRCKETKPIREFSRDRSSPDGHTRRCKACVSQAYKNGGYNKGRGYDPEKAAAHRAVARAVDQGVLKHIGDQRCQDCNGQAAHYHHESYAQEDRLKVIPLCHACHRARHRRLP